MPAPIRDLPPEYAEVYHLQLLDQPRLLLILNFAALVPMALMFVLLTVVRSTAADLRPAADAVPGPGAGLPWLLGMIITIVITLGFHELVHGLVIRWVGHIPRYGIKWREGVLYATADQALFRRNEYLLVALAPLVVISVIGIIGQFIVPMGFSDWLAVAAVINAGGAIGDIYMAWLLRRWPPGALVRDVEDGFRVYTAQPTG